jgi:hypothetical protein
MFGLVVMEVMTLSGHLSNINEITTMFHESLNTNDKVDAFQS